MKYRLKGAKTYRNGPSIGRPSH